MKPASLGSRLNSSESAVALRPRWGLLLLSIAGVALAGGMIVLGVNSSSGSERECALAADIAPTVATGALVKDLQSQIEDATHSPEGRAIDCGPAFARRGLRVLSDPGGPASGDIAISRPLFEDSSHAVVLVIHYGRMGEQVQVEERGKRWVVTKRVVDVVG